MTDLQERLDDLARTATAGLELAHPRLVAESGTTRHVRRTRLVAASTIATLMTAAGVIGTIAFVGSGDQADPDRVATGPAATADADAMREACDALGPVVLAFERLTSVDARTTSRLTDAAQAVAATSPPFAALTDAMAELPGDGIDVEELRTATTISTGVLRAIDECAANAVPGWVVEYIDPPPAATAGLVLPSRIERQTLTVTDEVLDSPPTGPGLGPITRLEVQGENVAVFRWTEDDGTVRLDCLSIVDALGRQATGCDPIGETDEADDSGAPRRIGERMDVGAGASHAFGQMVTPETAYVVVEVGERSWLQEPVAGVVALRVGRGAAFGTPLVIEYDADGEIVRRS